MTGLTPYLHLPGTAREALTSYGEAFGCSVQLHTLAEFGRTDGPADAIARGYLLDGPIKLFAADATGDQPPLRCEGMMLSLLGTAPPSTPHNWFTSPAAARSSTRCRNDPGARPTGRSSTGTASTGSSEMRRTARAERAQRPGALSHERPQQR